MVFLFSIISIKKIEKSITWEWYLGIGRIKSKIKRNFGKYLRNSSLFNDF